MTYTTTSAPTASDATAQGKALLGRDSSPEPDVGNAAECGADAVANAAGRTRSGRFTAGNRGKAKGTRNKATVLAEAVLAGDAEEIARVIAKDALRGHPDALKQCLDRFVPRTRERTLNVDLPAVASLADAADAMGRLTALVGAGELTPGEARVLASVIELQRRTLETSDHARRLAAVEEAVAALRTMVGEFLRSEIVVPAGTIPAEAIAPPAAGAERAA